MKPKRAHRIMLSHFPIVDVGPFVAAVERARAACQRLIDSFEAPRIARAPCPNCFESSGYMARHHPASWYEPAWEDSDPTSPCPVCHGTGDIECQPATLADLEDAAAEEEEGRA